MSNFIFPRRELQMTIDRLTNVLLRDQLVSIVKRLNQPSDARLPAMWELVILDALSRVGKLRHEIQLPNGRKPDIELTLSSTEGLPLTIIGDVTSVSDTGLNEQNPVHTLSAELNRLASKIGLDPHHFGFKVEGARVGPYADSRTKLFLPKKGQLLAIMKKEVMPWMRRLKNTPKQFDHFEYAEGEVGFSLTYNRAQQFASGNYLSYSVATSRDKNPLSQSLKSKVKQLKGAPIDAIRLIIVCDGGCDLLRKSSMMNTHETFSSIEVAENFLRKNSNIDAVLLMTINEQWSAMTSTATRNNSCSLVLAPPHARSIRMTPVTIATLEALLQKAIAHLPRPTQTAHNAARRCREPGCGPDMIGGYKMKDNCVSLSSRALQRLLAGDITANDFISSHGWNDDSGPSNPFTRMMTAGRMITNIEIQQGDNEDDDWLTFNFGSPDPAISPFHVPHPLTLDQSDKT